MIWNEFFVNIKFLGEQSITKEKVEIVRRIVAIKTLRDSANKSAEIFHFKMTKLFVLTTLLRRTFISSIKFVLCFDIRFSWTFTLLQMPVYFV